MQAKYYNMITRMNVITESRLYLIIQLLPVKHSVDTLWEIFVKIPDTLYLKSIFFPKSM